MPPLTTDQLAGEIGLIIEKALNAKMKTLKTGDRTIFDYLDADDFDDVVYGASDEAADLIGDRLCRFAKEHPAECQLCA